MLEDMDAQSLTVHHNVSEYLKDSDSFAGTFIPQDRKAEPFVTRQPSTFAPNPNKSYLVKSLIAPGKFGMIYGPPGTGKSIIGPYLAHRVAQGWTEESGGLVFGRRVCGQPVNVLYVTGEDVEGMEERLLGLATSYGPADRLHFLGGNLNFWRDDCPDYDRLMATVAQFRPSLIFVDTIASVFPGMEENSGGDMGTMFAKLRSAMELCNAALIGVHHSPKSGETPRGHGSLEGTLELSMFLKREGNLVTARIVKNKQGPSGGIIPFAIGMAHLGTDNDGDPMMAPICEEAVAEPISLKKLSPEAKTAYQILCDLLSGSGAKLTPKESGFPGKPVYCVQGAEWQAECARRSLVLSDDPKVQTAALERAYKALRATNLVGACNKIVWNARSRSVNEFTAIPNT